MDFDGCLSDEAGASKESSSFNHDAVLSLLPPDDTQCRIRPRIPREFLQYVVCFSDTHDRPSRSVGCSALALEMMSPNLALEHASSEERNESQCERNAKE